MAEKDRNVTQIEYHNCIDRWADDLYRFACHCCNDSQEADDAVQEAYTELWEQHDGVTTETAKRFLFVVAQRRIADRYRRTRKENETLDNVNLLAEQPDAERFELRDVVQRAMTQLTEQQRAILTLHDMEGYDYTEIAEMLRMSYTRVQVVTFRARIKMKTILTRLGYNPK